MIALLLLLPIVNAFQTPSQIITQRISHDAVKSDSPRFRNWIRIPLHPELISMFNGEVPLIKRILWCRSIGSGKENSARLADPTNLLRGMALVEPNAEEFGCSSPGFVHFQMYPGSKMMTHQPDDEPQVIYIDPASFGGIWDETHEMEIVVDMRVSTTHTAQHVARFNFPKNIVATKKPIVPPPHPWKAVLGILLGGMVFFACMAYFMYRSKMEKFKPTLQPEQADTDEDVLERMAHIN